MKRYASTDLKQNLGDVLAAANQQPVSITRHNKPRYVLMSVEAFEANFRREARTAYAIEEAPPEHLTMIEKYLAGLEGE